MRQIRSMVRQFPENISPGTRRDVHVVRESRAVGCGAGKRVLLGGKLCIRKNNRTTSLMQKVRLKW